MARLEIRKLKKVSRVEIETSLIRIGRASTNNVVLRDEAVSREHCAIELSHGIARLRDLNSRTGTMLNGTRISEATLQHHDHISVGPFVLVFRDPERSLAPADDDASITTCQSPPAPESLEQTAAADQKQLEAAQELLTRQMSQIAELTAAAASLHSQVVDKSDQVASLQRELELLVEQQRRRDASHKSDTNRDDQVESRRTDYTKQIEALDEITGRLACLQEQVAATEAKWAAADQRLSEAGDASARPRRDELSAALNRLNHQRDAAIGELQAAISKFRQTVSTGAHSSGAGSSGHWWRFGARRRS